MKRLMQAFQLGITTTIGTWRKLDKWAPKRRAGQALTSGMVAFNLFLKGGYNG